MSDFAAIVTHNEARLQSMKTISKLYMLSSYSDTIPRLSIEIINQKIKVEQLCINYDLAIAVFSLR